MAPSIGSQNEATERIRAACCDCGVASGNVGQGSILLRRVPAIICLFYPIALFLDPVTAKEFRQPFFSINSVPRGNRCVLPARNCQEHFPGGLQQCAQFLHGFEISVALLESHSIAPDKPYVLHSRAIQNEIECASGRSICKRSPQTSSTLESHHGKALLLSRRNNAIALLYRVNAHVSKSAAKIEHIPLAHRQAGVIYDHSISLSPERSGRFRLPRLGVESACASRRNPA